MSNFISFLSGTIFGAYISQNYDIINIKNSSKKIIKYFQSIEKNIEDDED